MKTTKAKKLPKRLLTVADYSRKINSNSPAQDTDNTTDTTVTMTIITTTINPHFGFKF